jgi:hypothetical protein
MSNDPEYRPQPKPKLIAEYLLFIGRSASAYKRHRRSPKDADDAMTEFGLDEQQRGIVLTEINENIRSEAQKELDSCGPGEPPPGSDPADYGAPFILTFRTCVTC